MAFSLAICDNLSFTFRTFLAVSGSTLDTLFKGLDGDVDDAAVVGAYVVGAGLSVSSFFLSLRFLFLSAAFDGGADPDPPVSGFLFWGSSSSS